MTLYRTRLKFAEFNKTRNSAGKSLTLINLTKIIYLTVTGILPALGS